MTDNNKIKKLIDTIFTITLNTLSSQKERENCYFRSLQTIFSQLEETYVSVI